MQSGHEKNIPQQEKGAGSDTSHAVRTKSREEARALFSIAKGRLLNISGWDKLCGYATANFVLADSNGKDLKRPAIAGDYLKIDIPGPGSKTGDGFDWVRIEKIEHTKDESKDSEMISMKVRPSSNPTNNSAKVAHFFKKDATSTFIVQREGLVVKAEVHGRNELPNTRQKRKLDILRNFLIAIGAMLGLSKSQWKKLVKGLVAAPEENKE